MTSLKTDSARHADPHVVLGIAAGAPHAAIREAYLRKVKEYPPDRAPARFEQVRDAYEVLRDPRGRIRHQLFFMGDGLSLTALVDGRPLPRKFTGPRPWQTALEED